MRWFRGHADAPRLLSLSPLRADEELEGASLGLHVESRLRDMSPVRWARRKSSSSESERNCYNVQTSEVTTERASQKKDKKRIQEERRRSCEKRNPLLDRVKNTRLSFFKDAENATREVNNETREKSEKMKFHNELGGLARNEFRRSVCEIDLKDLNERDKIHTKRKRRCKSQSRLPSRSRSNEEHRFLDWSEETRGTTTTTNRWNPEIDNEKDQNKSFDETSIEEVNTSESCSRNASSCLAAKFRAIQDRYLKSSTSKLIAKIYRKEDAKDNKRRLRSLSYGTLPGLEELRTNPLYSDEQRHQQQQREQQDDNDSGINGSATSSILDDRGSLTIDSIPPELPPRLKFETRSIIDNLTREEARCSSSREQELVKRNAKITDPRINDEKLDGNGLSVVRSRSYTTETSVVKLDRQSTDQCLGIFIAKTSQSGYLVAHVVPNGLAEGILRIGDEILIVNGKRLRGLSMTEARKILGNGSPPGQVDIVISRKIDSPKRLRESSVDYENLENIVNNNNNNSNKNNNNNNDFDSSGSHFRKHNSRHHRKNESSLRNCLNDNGQQNAVSNFCTLPRRPRSTVSTFHTVLLEKGHGKKSLGFTIVGGRDSPKGSIGIFIKSVLPGGQAAEDGRLRAGDEILAVNGQVSHDLTHREAVQLFRNIKSGSLALHICRRVKNRATPMPKAKSCADLLLVDA